METFDTRSVAYGDLDGGDAEPVLRIRVSVPFRSDNFEWSDMRIRDLYAFLRLHKTPTQISAIMHCTRSSVIAVMVQLRLRRKAANEDYDGDDMRLEKSRAVPPPTVSLAQPGRAEATIANCPVEHQPHPVETLTTRSCRYPIGTPGQEGFRFCLADKGDREGSYCPKHHRATHRSVG